MGTKKKRTRGFYLRYDTATRVIISKSVCISLSQCQWRKCLYLKIFLELYDFSLTFSNIYRQIFGHCDPYTQLSIPCVSKMAKEACDDNFTRIFWKLNGLETQKSRREVEKMPMPAIPNHPYKIMKRSPISRRLAVCLAENAVIFRQNLFDYMMAYCGTLQKIKCGIVLGHCHLNSIIAVAKRFGVLMPMKAHSLHFYWFGFSYPEPTVNTSEHIYTRATYYVACAQKYTLDPKPMGLKESKRRTLIDIPKKVAQAAFPHDLFYKEKAKQLFRVRYSFRLGWPFTRPVLFPAHVFQRNHAFRVGGCMSRKTAAAAVVAWHPANIESFIMAISPSDFIQWYDSRFSKKLMPHTAQITNLMAAQPSPQPALEMLSVWKPWVDVGTLSSAACALESFGGGILTETTTVLCKKLIDEAIAACERDDFTSPERCLPQLYFSLSVVAERVHYKEEEVREVIIQTVLKYADDTRFHGDAVSYFGRMKNHPTMKAHNESTVESRLEAFKEDGSYKDELEAIAGILYVVSDKALLHEYANFDFLTDNRPFRELKASPLWKSLGFTSVLCLQSSFKKIPRILRELMVEVFIPPTIKKEFSSLLKRARDGEDDDSDRPTKQLKRS